MSLVLLDTHILVWSQEQPARLGKKTQRLLLDPSHSLLVSAISALEIARLASLTQLSFTTPPASWFDNAVAALGARVVEVSTAVCFEAYGLSGELHKDPADRMIIATARLFDATLVTADERLLRFAFVRSHDARR